MTPYDFELAMKVTIAAIIGAAIGYERQRYQKPAGIRTQMLICVGSALLAGLSIDIAEQHTVPGALMRPDPTRLMAQIIAGIGFIGGGVILKGNDRISGVTTAATIWLTAAVGVAVGAGFYLVAAFCAALMLAAHFLTRMKHKTNTQRITFMLRLPRKNWTNAVGMLEDMKVGHHVISISSLTCVVKVFTTQNIKEKIAKELDTKGVDFEIENIV